MKKIVLSIIILSFIIQYSFAQTQFTSEKMVYSWTVKHVETSKVLDVSASKGTLQLWNNLNRSSTNVQNSNNQRWVKIEYDNGKTFKLQNRHTKKVLDVSASRVILQMWDDLGNSSTYIPNANNQKWIYVDGYIENVHFKGKVLSVVNGQVVIENKNGGSHQKWEFIDVALELNAQPLENGRYTITNAHFKTYLFYSRDKDNKSVYLNNNTYQAEQHGHYMWDITHVGDGFYQIKSSYYNKCLDASAGTKGKVQTWTWLNYSNEYGTNGKNQIWKIVPDGKGSYKIFNGWYTDMVLEASASKQTIQLWSDLDNSSQYVPEAKNQKWIFEKK